MLLSENIIYEQPLNEHLRVCLRLEYLFEKVKYLLSLNAIMASRMALVGILEILNTIDRPDLKTKLSKAISHRITTLSQLENIPQIDSKRLKEILNELDQLIHRMHNMTGKFGQPLRENDFLNSVRLQLSRPGGAMDFNCPMLHFWLQQPLEQRNKLVMQWLQELELIQSIVSVLLRLTRESSILQVKFANKGFYQENLNPSLPCELIRVSIDAERKVFPEISVGRHRLSIYFLSPNFEGKSMRAIHDIPFKLACCTI